MFKSFSITMFLLCLASIGYAQRIEITPIVSYKFGGSVPVMSERPVLEDVNKIKFDDSLSYGIGAGYNFTEHFGVEFMWNRQATNAIAELNGGGQLDQTTDVNLDQYLGNFLYHFGDEDARLRPFVLVGAGATRAAGAGNSETKFTFNVSGGIKYFFHRNFLLRAQARWTPTYLFSTAGGVWCNWWGVCWVVPNDHFMNQGEVSVGAVFRF